MSGFSENSDRRVLPVWQSAAAAAGGIEMQPVTLLPSAKLDKTVVDDIALRREEFSQKANIGTAADLLNSAVLSNKTNDVHDVAQFILQNKENAPEPLVILAQKLINPVRQDELLVDLDTQRRQKISELRRLLRIEPRNSVLLVDLAREYSSIGKISAAHKAIISAISLSNGNRWVNRMAARFLVHAGKKGEAYNLISNHPSIQNDPWMLSAEIAIAQASGRDPKHWTRAKHLLNGTIPPRHLSELACAVGTMELASGNGRKARKNFRQALIDPTDNSLAQLKWAERNLKADLLTDERLFERENAYEAQFWSAYYRADILIARKYAELWLNEEPFSKRPATMLCFVCSLLDDHSRAQQAADWGLGANSDDTTLRLNKYFSYISSRMNWNDKLDLNTIEKISKDLVSIAATSGFAIHAKANLGLLAYRTGKFEKGRAEYEAAEKIAGGDDRDLSVASARIFHAREAIIHQAPWANLVLEDARNALTHVHSPGLRFYLSKVDYAFKNPDKVKFIFSSDFVLDADKNKVENVRPKGKITFDIKAGGATIWLPRIK